jgi:RHS repeat-associated protein
VLSELPRPRHAFVGHEPDPGTGYYQFGKRMYDPTLRRWISPDPLFLTNPEMDLDKGDELNLYQYGGNNPVKFTDTSGEILETAWDVVNVGMGVASFVVNVSAGNWGGAAMDAAGVIMDAAAVVVPGVPGGAGTAIKASRAADKVKDVVQAADKTADAAKAAKGVDKAGDAAGAAKNGKQACFVAGTPVSTTDGFMPIETLKPNQLVWAYNPETNETKLKPVVQTFVREVSELVILTIGDDKIETTTEHPFWLEGKGFIEAGEIQPNDVVRTLSGELKLVETVHLEPRNELVYNFEVADFHTYFVGHEAVLVHNTCPDKEKPSLGTNGTQVTSKTLWKGKGKERIDVENPNPGQRPGQIHYQDKDNKKYLYDPSTKSFPGAPNSVNKLLKDKKFMAAIKKGMKKYLGEN